MQHAMIIDYKYCTGCESCVVSCAKEKGLGAEEWGMKVEQIGPNKIGGKWEWDYVPVPSKCIEIVPVEDVSKRLADLGEHKVCCFMP